MTLHLVRRRVCNTCGRLSPTKKYLGTDIFVWFNVCLNDVRRGISLLFTETIQFSYCRREKGIEVLVCSCINCRDIIYIS